MNTSDISPGNQTTSKIISVAQIYLTSIVLVIVFIGFILNLFSAFYFRFIKTKGNFILLLFVLSLIETIYGLSFLITQLWFYFTYLMKKKVSNSFLAWVGAQFIHHGLRNIYRVFLFLRNWMIAFIAWMRFQVVSQPLRSQAYGNKRVKYGLIVILLIAFILTIPKMFDSKIDIENKTGNVMFLRKQMSMNMGYNYYFIPFYSFMLGLLPTFIILFYSVFLINEVRKRNEQFLDVHQLRAPSPTKTILMLCVIFTLCEIPKSICYIIYYISMYRELTEYRYIVENLADIVNILSSLDSIMNFIAYLYAVIKRKSSRKQRITGLKSLPKDNSNNTTS